MAKVPNEILGHWNHLIEDFDTSSQQFYTLVEEAIKRRNLPKVKLSRIYWKEGGVMSAKREYLRVKRREHVFDICGAPYGNAFFFSTWLGEFRSGCLSLILEIPFVGVALKFFIGFLINPMTYYRVDTAHMFQKSVHAAVMEVIDALTEEKGLKALTESERKPIMKDFFKKSLF